MTLLNTRCCCSPNTILGTVEVPFQPTAACDITTDHGTLHIREYYELRQGGLYKEFAVEGHEGKQ
jgi:hypothetical protein